MVMTTQQMIDNIAAAGWKVQLHEPSADSRYWRAFAFKVDRDHLSGAKQVISLDSENMAMRLLSNALGFPVPPGEYVPPLRTMVMALLCAVDDNLKARSARR